MSYVENAYVQEEVLRELPLTHISGIEPNDPTNVSIIVNSGTAYLSFRVPDTIIDSKRLCTVKGAVILRKVGSPPTHQYDGTIIGSYDIATINNSSNVPIEDSGLLISVQYYYWIMPYSDHGVYNIHDRNIFPAAELENAFYYHEYTISSLPATINDSAITSDMVVIQSEMSDKTIPTSDWSYTTSTGTIVITGSKSSGNVTAKLLFAKKDSSLVYSNTVTFSELPYTITNEKIKDGMVLAQANVTSGMLASEIDYVTSDGTIVLSGTSPASSVTMELTFVQVNSFTTIEREYVIGALPYVVEDDPALKASMYLAESYLYNPSVATSDWGIEITDGGLTITGSLSGSTKIRLLLVDTTVNVIAKPYIYREYSITSLPATFQDVDIKSTMYLAQAEMSNPAAQTGDWTITTADDSINIDGSLNGSTTLKLLLANTANNAIVHKQYAITELPYSASDMDITADMVVSEAWITNGRQLSDLTITTSDGGLVISGTYSESFTIDLILIEKNPITYIEREYVIGVLPYTSDTDEYIKGNMVVAQAEFSNPTAQTSDWTVTTSNGSLNIAGTNSGSTRLKLQLAQPAT